MVCGVWYSSRCVCVQRYIVRIVDDVVCQLFKIPVFVADAVDVVYMCMFCLFCLVCYRMGGVAYM